MKITIEGHRFDTALAKHHFALVYVDHQSNRHSGDLYCSSRGQWYVYTPSQWSNCHSWQLTTAEEALSDYDRYLTDDQKKQIAQLGDLDWE